MTTHALENLNDLQKFMVHTYHQLIMFITNKRRDDSIPSNNLEITKDLVIYDQVKFTNDDSLFLLHGDPNEVEERMFIYAAKSHLTELKDKEVWISNATFSSCLKILDQLWVIHPEVEERWVPFIHVLKIGTKQEGYVHSLKTIKKEIQKIVIKEQETRPPTAGRPPKDHVASIQLKTPKLVLLDFEAAQSIASREIFGCATQGCYFNV
ncbi:hypothetical protein DSO57_1021586 [Entomophthora muscae]|uniref:Uncharacterized protein n=1 Tax=Entomophthora muscae TaxID=34485 RepID=A0ACC2TEK0_9FUNG|nr:hypothetical protein DSO57_1021586 [Entomophthora muscae]